MPKGLELNIALGSPRVLTCSSTLILHYFWVCSCLGMPSEDMVQRRGPAHGSMPSTAPGCRRPNLVFSAYSVPGEVRPWGSVATCGLLLRSSKQGEEVTGTHAASRRCTCWREWWKGRSTKGLKHKLVNANTYRTHSEPLLNMTWNPDWPLPITYNVK